MSFHCCMSTKQYETLRNRYEIFFVLFRFFHTFSQAYKRNAIKAESAKRIAITIVAWNKNFSNPRRVLNPPPSAPPKAPPTPALDCCSKIAPTRRIARIICIHGSKEVNNSITGYYSMWADSMQHIPYTVLF